MERPPADQARFLRKSAVARIAGTTPGHYGTLLGEEVVGARPPRLLPAIADGGCSLMDCIRLVVLKSLIDALNRDARAAYCRIRDQIPEVLLVDELDVVYDRQSGSGRAVSALARPSWPTPSGWRGRWSWFRWARPSGTRVSDFLNRLRRVGPPPDVAVARAPPGCSGSPPDLSSWRRLATARSFGRPPRGLRPCTPTTRKPVPSESWR